jgi:hypothetical protein
VDTASLWNEVAARPPLESINGSSVGQSSGGVPGKSNVGSGDTNDLIDLGDGRVQLPSGRIVRPNVTVQLAAGPEIPETPGPLTLYGSPVDTLYPVINKPAFLKDKSLYYSYGADGTAFWRDGATGKIWSPNAPYASPTLGDFADLSRANGSSNPWAQLPTMGSALGGFALNSAIGTVAMFTGGLGYGAAEAIGASRFFASAAGDINSPRFIPCARALIPAEFTFWSGRRRARTMGSRVGRYWNSGLQFGMWCWP